MRVLVTGGAGFIGSNVIHHLARVAPEMSVTVLDDLSTGRAANLEGLDVRQVIGSILDPEALDAAAAGADAIVHLAALPSVPRSMADPLRSHHANATGTLHVLEAARAHGVSQVIVASSSSVYGSNLALPKREDAWTRPMSPYAASKLATEAYALAYASSFGLDVLAFRFFNVYGPRQAADHAYAAVIPTFIDRALNGRAIERQGDGEQSRDFTHVRSVCAAIHAVLSRGLSSPQPINLAFGTNTTLNRLIEVIEKAVGMPVAIDQRPARVGDVRASQADREALTRLIPEVQPVDLVEGVTETVAWFRDQRARP